MELNRMISSTNRMNSSKSDEDQNLTVDDLIKDHKFRWMIIESIRQYETGYHEEFWDLETDECHNY